MIVDQDGNVHETEMDQLVHQTKSYYTGTPPEEANWPEPKVEDRSVLSTIGSTAWRNLQEGADRIVDGVKRVATIPAALVQGVNDKYNPPSEISTDDVLPETIGAEVATSVAGLSPIRVSPYTSFRWEDLSEIMNPGAVGNKHPITTHERFLEDFMDHTYKPPMRIEGKSGNAVNVSANYHSTEKTIYVNNIWADEGKGSIGPSAIRQILRDLKDKYPEAERIAGFRISGARSESGKIGNAVMDLK